LINWKKFYYISVISGFFPYINTVRHKNHIARYCRAQLKKGGSGMKKLILVLAVAAIASMASNNANAEGYQHGWKVYEKPQPGYTYGGVETNQYGPGGSKSYGPGGGRSYGPGGGRSYGPGGGKSYGPGGGNSYGPGGGKNPANPWSVAD
jgi:hypothetical protein